MHTAEEAEEEEGEEGWLSATLRGCAVGKGCSPVRGSNAPSVGVCETAMQLRGARTSRSSRIGNTGGDRSAHCSSGCTEPAARASAAASVGASTAGVIVARVRIPVDEPFEI